LVNTPPDRQTLPVVQKIRMRYEKLGRMKFSSHRDFQRALERAIRRSKIPIAYSAGFSPHPKISYANAAPTGCASLAEYIEIGLTEPVDPELVKNLINEALGDGLSIKDAVVARNKDFIDQLEASLWQIELSAVSESKVREAVKKLLENQEVVVERLTKQGIRKFDARGAILALRVNAAEPSRGYAIIEVVVRSGNPTVRPDDVLSALKSAGGLALTVPPMVTRRAQGKLTEDPFQLLDPFALDRE
jgi:radical SAM-linked protein